MLKWLNTKGIPTHLNLGNPEAVDSKEIEASGESHKHADDAEHGNLDDDRTGDSHHEFSEETMKTLDRQIRITRADLETVGTTPGCPRCPDIDSGQHKTTKNHSRECRPETYLQYKEADSPKWRAVKHLIETVTDEPNTQSIPHDTKESDALPPPRDQPRLGSAEGDKVDPVYVDVPHVGDRHSSPDGSDPHHLSVDEAWDMLGPDEDEKADCMDDDEIPQLLEQDVPVSFISVGAEPAHANDNVYRLFSLKPTTFDVLYGRVKVVDENNRKMISLNVRGVDAFDCRTLRKDGVLWDLHVIESKSPNWIVESPPSTACCQWNLRINKDEMDPADYPKLKADGRRLLRYA